MDAWIVLLMFLITYIFILFFERIPRTTAALAGAITIMIYGMVRLSVKEHDAIHFIRFDILILLMSMMIIVNVLLDTGFFGYIALKLVQISKGNVGHLVLFLGFGTAFLSMVVDNVTTIILFIPITIEIAKKLEINPVPFLMAEAILANIGGVATMVGDPPNIIIASYSGLSFNDFFIHLFPVVLIVGFAATFIIRYAYRDWICDGVSCYERIAELDPRDEITDRVMMNRTLMILAAVFAFFIFHDHLGVTPAFVALAGASITLLVNYYDPEKVLKHVEWSSLLFFASLFVIVGVMEVVGIFMEVANLIRDLAGHDELRAALLILWITGLLTSFVDRISTTVAMAPVIIQLGTDIMTEGGAIEPGLNMIPLWWALAMGVGFGGNSTPIGSAAGIVTVGLSSKFGVDISLWEWFRIGFPTALFSLMVATLLFIGFWGFLS